MNCKSYNQLKNFLIENNLKVTKQRKIIFDAFNSIAGHFTVQDLYEKLTENNLDIGMATISRTLNIFVKCKIAKGIKVGNKMTMYENNNGEHYHLRCIRCGRLIEVKSYRMIKLIKEISRDNNFNFVSSTVIISGLCEECKSIKGDIV